MTHSKTLFALLFGTGLALSAPVHAQNALSDVKDQKGQAIVSVYYSNSTSGFDADGNSVDIADYEKLEASVYIEYEATEDLTLIFKPSLRDISVEGGDDSSGFGFTDLGARYDVLKSDQGWLALEGAVRIPGIDVAENLAQVGSTDTEYDVRLHGFHNIGSGPTPAFIDAQIGYRFRDGDPPNEYHADFSVGYRPASDWLILAQSFNTVSDGAGQGIFESFRFHNVQLSAVKDVSQNVSLQLGMVGTVAGENALRERGLFGGFWYRF